MPLHFLENENLIDILHVNDFTGIPLSCRGAN
jgi:hypothetical protein